ncbi:hypothetical protein V1389_14685 [Flavobacterium rakeshii]|uniref:hypothetical protein n=1 Tax=Flavobacterium rakeshii TaxID=1038845 RepID=UPI002E7AC990|nr:hypothetical protein [Flavobacterium rakeshii]MEE1899593.1 hypothetical protein [Flavobacterium rakeshii]
MKKIYLILLLILWGCNSHKTLLQKEVAIKNDSLILVSDSTTEINREITDKTTILFPEINTGISDCDSVCNLERDKALALLNRQIQSGNNEYSLLYDKYNKLITLQTQIGSTRDTDNNKAKENFHSETDNTIQEVPVYIIPAFYRYGTYFGCASLVIFLFLIQNKFRSWLSKKSII